MAEKSILRTIEGYLGPDGLPRTEFGLRCLVGMLETGEADVADLVVAGGDGLAVKVAETKAWWDEQRRTKADVWGE